MPSQLSNLSNMFRVGDLRKKVLFTLIIIAVYRLGANIPCPGISYKAVQAATSASGTGTFGFLNLFTGGALARFAVFGLGIMPYITSSIIIQLLMVVIPKFEKWRDEGAAGQKKLTQITRYVTIVLALLQSTTLAYAFHSGSSTLLGTSSNIDFIPHFTIARVLLIVLTMTAGTVVVMWLGELVTQRGIGQGMSILIFSNVVATLPSGGAAIKDGAGWGKLIIVIAISVILLGCIVFVEQGQRRIPVTFAKRVVGRRMYGGQSTYIPMKVNTGGVVPIIFASSVLYFPVLISNVLPSSGWGLTVQTWVNTHLGNNPTDTVYIVAYGILILGFAYFYAALTFDPHQQADIIRKQGGYIPGIRPGAPTERHLQMILNRITLPGAVWLGAIALLPSLMLSLFHIHNYPFAGTTLLISVGVALETMKQVDSQLMLRNYEGFLR